jgi:putative transposase
MRSRYKSVYTGNSYFITSSIVNWIKVFDNKKYVRFLIVAIKFNQKDKGLEIFAYVIMKNHFHIICRANDLGKAVSSIKSYSAKQIIKQLKTDNEYDILEIFEINKLKYKSDRKYQIWQEGYHPQEIVDDKMYKNKIRYVHYNPVKAGYVNDICDWEFSSAGDYYRHVKGSIELKL